ncbi:hypothetical protein FC39_GL001709 [Lactobacillus hamsteri DSM 5661 = JCM 6256]|uniref:Abasic site processing protein n=2 Tax=Lactobacillus hamsteri TaxID=96565 RepID=A0A0R1YMG0_9LACO|nr:hypothetical protein FC39_GL001709 [Lactobacillus hamsteri DSM 5661 = JCM 6256]
MSEYLTQGLGLPLIPPDFSSEEKDVFPKQKAPVMLFKDNQLQLQNKNWGYPSPIDNNKVIFNARIERFYDSKPSMWDNSFARQRCIIVASEFFEYSKNTYPATNGKTYHERFSFSDPEHPLTLIAGIYDKDNFSMVTTEPNSYMAPIHNRMPLVIKPEKLRRWLFQNFTNLIDRSDFDLSVKKLPNEN